MKALFLTILILVTGNSFGTSIQPGNIRLQLATTSLTVLHYLPFGEQKATVISVNSLGDVVGSRCTEKTNVKLGVGRPVYTNCHDVKYVEFLSAEENRKMEILISEARHGKIKLPNPQTIHCLAVPNHSARYTADNGNILLSVGTFPCGNGTFNTSKAAAELVQTLREYSDKYNASFPTELN